MEIAFRRKLFSALIAGGIVILLFGIVASCTWPQPVHPPREALLPTLAATTTTAVVAPENIPPPDYCTYLEVLDSCGVAFDGEPCVNMRSGPGLQYSVLRQLRNGVVLKVASTTVTDGRTWYKIGFDDEIQHPERVTGDWYVAADYVHLFFDTGVVETDAGLNASSTKRIVIDLTNETLYAYDGAAVFMQQPISTGLELTPTQKGTYWVYRKLPDSYMQGPTLGFSDQFFDLPGVPWVLYFNTNGSAIHGTYWHNNFGQIWSHGCVNLPPDQAKLLYEWADLGTPVIVQN